MRSLARERWHAACRSPTLIVGLLILAFWIVCALFGTAITPCDPYADDLLATLAPPSAAHWFGTDQLGRDIFSRVIVGARDILIVAPLATLLGTVLGTALGLSIGYFRGVLDDVVGRIIEALQALPLVIVALMALAAVGTSNATVVLVIGFVFTPLSRVPSVLRCSTRPIWTTSRRRVCGATAPSPSCSSRFSPTSCRSRSSK